MNKKVLGMVAILLAAAMLATQMVGTAHACKWGLGPRTIETFYVYPDTIPHPPSMLTGLQDVVPPTEKFACNGTIRIGWGAVRQYIYNGPLGQGTVQIETMISISHVGGGTIVFPSVGLQNVTGYGSGISKYILEITTDGGYGTGTLMGVGTLMWEWNWTGTPPHYEQVNIVTLRPVAGDLNIIRACIGGYTRIQVGYTGQWWNTTVIS